MKITAMVSLKVAIVVLVLHKEQYSYGKLVIGWINIVEPFHFQLF
jgi:hypothetical protein